MRISLTIIVLSILFVSGALGADWTQYRGSHGDGKSTETLGPLPGNSASVTELWKVDTPLGFSSFSVAGGGVFTLATQSHDGDNQEVCLALDAIAGHELWRVALGVSDYGSGGGNSGAEDNNGGDGPRSTPASDGERVYVYDSHLGLYCFDAKTGDVIWMKDVAEEFGGENIRWKNAASPLLTDRVVYVAGGGAGQAFLAFDKLNGELLWSSGEETMTHATPVFATIQGSRQVIFFTQSGLVAVDHQNGDELWNSEFPFSVSTAASPVVFGELVYCSAGYGVGAGLFKIDKTNRDLGSQNVWQRPNELMNHWSTPVCRDGYLYGIYGFKKYGEAPLQCVELESGEIQWSEVGFGAGNCILVGDKILALTDFGEVVVVNAAPDAYVELARAKVIKGKCWSTPAFSDGRIYVRSTVEGACVEFPTAAGIRSQP